MKFVSESKTNKYKSTEIFPPYKKVSKRFTVYYYSMVQVMPTVSPMLEQCTENLNTWKRLAEERKVEKEEQEKTTEE